jgi:5-hydroxyisourate hydrolase
MSGITTHVLDTARGKPAEGVAVILEIRTEDGWLNLGNAATDPDGRARRLLPEGAALMSGTYRLTFATGAYFRDLGIESFFPETVVVFEVKNPEQHYHVPLLLSPFGYSTYRGS